MQVLEIDNGTVFIQRRHKDLRPLSKPLYDMIDWLALAKQKRELLQIMDAADSRERTNLLDGLLNLIDGIQDDAEAAGYPVVWFYAEDDWRNGDIENDDE